MTISFYLKNFIHFCLSIGIISFLGICGQQVEGTAEFQAEWHDCGHTPPSREEVISHVGVRDNTNHIIRKRDTYEPLRIRLYYDESISRLPASHQLLVTSMVEEAVDYWQRTLMVKRSVTPIRLNRQCLTNIVYKDQAPFCVMDCASRTKCGDIYIPESHLERCYYFDVDSRQWRSSRDAGPGVDNADFILYVAALSAGRCHKSRTIAYAAHCQQEFILDRPVAGYFSICPETISIEKQDHLQLLSTMKHEILHALGFTAGLYAFYRDSNGIPLTPRNPESNKPRYDSSTRLYRWSDRVAKTFTRQNWKSRNGYSTKVVTMIVTPTVKREVRRHYNCPTLEGAELEDQGIVGTALTHWEKRLFENEAMTGTYTQNPVISRITLAMMEDTGWYKANYDNAEELEWGKNMRCNFVYKSCMDWIDASQISKTDIHPYCKDVRRGILKTDCTKNRNAVAFCNLVEYNTSLPQKYQYFDYLQNVPQSAVSRYGGSVALADYCPYLQEFTWTAKGVTVRDSRCTLPENNPDPSINFFGEDYSIKSKCINHGNIWQVQHCSRLITTSHAGSGCYRYYCSRDAGVVLYIHDRSYQCLKAGQEIPITYVSSYYLHKGTVICPSCQEICKDSGFICPPEREPYNIIDESSDNLRAPCSAKSVLHPSLYNIAWTSIVANILCFLAIWFCHR